jgi:hypothetical protein
MRPVSLVAAERQHAAAAVEYRRGIGRFGAFASMPWQPHNAALMRCAAMIRDSGALNPMHSSAAWCSVSTSAPDSLIVSAVSPSSVAAALMAVYRSA